MKYFTNSNQCPFRTCSCDRKEWPCTTLHPAQWSLNTILSSISLFDIPNFQGLVSMRSQHLLPWNSAFLDPQTSKVINLLTLILRSPNHKGYLQIINFYSYRIDIKSPGKLKLQNDGFFRMAFPKISLTSLYGSCFFFLVGGWTNPFEKYDSQMEIFPRFRAENLKIFEKAPPSFFGMHKFWGTIWGAFQSRSIFSANDLDP